MKSLMQCEILCAVDLEHDSYAAEFVAYALAKKLSAKLTLLHVDSTLRQMRYYNSYSNQFFPNLELNRISAESTAELIRQLRHRVHAIGAAGDSNVTVEVIEGEPAEEIFNYVKKSKFNVEYIVLSKRKRSFFDEFFLGSVAHQIVEMSTVPVLLIPDDKSAFVEWNPQQFFIASSLENEASQSLQNCLPLVEAFRSKMILVHIMPDKLLYQNSMSDNLVQSQKDDLDLFFTSSELKVKKQMMNHALKLNCLAENVECQVLFGSAIEKLAGLGTDLAGDVLVVGRNISTGFIPSFGAGIAGSLARTARCPLLIVPHQK